nr:DNA methyltransferase [Miltoncostaea marina]
MEALAHVDDTRVNIPTAEYEPVVEDDTRAAIRVAYERRNRDLDPQLVWRGKDEQDLSDLVVAAPPIYIQEKVHPKALIDALSRRSDGAPPSDEQMDLFADFNGLEADADRTDFYQHEQNWTNRMILGDSLQVMASLAEREGLRGKVQCIYIDPPYGIKFNSNFQWSTTTRDVKDGKSDHITREPEQVRAFRDTWRDGIHSYLAYLRDRLTLALDLLSPTGSIFVQIGDENVHRVRALLDEVFGGENFVSLISFVTTSGFTQASALPRTGDYLIWYAKSTDLMKVRPQWIHAPARQGYRWLAIDGWQRAMTTAEEGGEAALPDGAFVYNADNLISQGAANDSQPFEHEGKTYTPPANAHWKANYPAGMRRLAAAGRIHTARNSIRYRRGLNDFPYQVRTNLWTDTGTGNFTDDKVYVVQTASKVIQRCILLTTDPGDLVLDPTCGSGTTAAVSEEWGRRWITIDTSRVALALARARIMGARYPYYVLADSAEGHAKKAEIGGGSFAGRAFGSSVRQGFVYERIPHVTLKSIANNAEIDAIWERWTPTVDALRADLNAELSTSWEEWEVPRNLEEAWSPRAKDLHEKFCAARNERQAEIDASIASKAEQEMLYDRPHEDKRKVRVAGPFTVESVSPYRFLGVDENDELIDPLANETGEDAAEQAFVRNILESLGAAGVQQVHKDDRIVFTALTPWPGERVCAEGRYLEGEVERRAGVFVGPEFGSVLRADLVEAAREAADAGFDALIACAFSYEPHTTEFTKLGRLPVLKARMNADLHMSEDLKNTGKGNLFVIFGEPDIDVLDAGDGKIQVRINGVDVFDPSAGDVRSDSTEGIACWFVDTDYDEESFFVRHAYFLGADDPYKALKTTLRAEIDADAWATLNSDVSRPFPKPETGRIAVKVINHLGDEVMKVFRVS